LSCCLQSYLPHSHLPSFPTRRSSDLHRRKDTCTHFDGIRGTESGDSYRVGAAAVRCSGISSFQKTAGGLQRHETFQYYVKAGRQDRKSTRLSSSHTSSSYAVFCSTKR